MRYGDLHIYCNRIPPFIKIQKTKIHNFTHLFLNFFVEKTFHDYFFKVFFCDRMRKGEMTQIKKKNNYKKSFFKLFCVTLLKKFNP